MLYSMYSITTNVVQCIPSPWYDIHSITSYSVLAIEVRTLYFIHVHMYNSIIDNR